MRKISSSRLFFFRRLLPVIWLLVCLGPVIPVLVDPRALRALLAMPVVLGVIFVVIYRKIISPLADEVLLDGSDVVVRKKGQEARFPLRDIINVESSITNPPRIVLTLREPCVLGGEISFLLPGRVRLFSRPPLATELIALSHGLDPSLLTGPAYRR